MSEYYLKEALDKIFDYFKNNLTKQAFLAYNTKIIKYDENEWVIIEYTFDKINKGINRNYYRYSSAYNLLLAIVKLVSINSYEYNNILNDLNEEINVLRRKI